jgi:Escherichia/Staphylococcus phage prohead protease
MWTQRHNSMNLERRSSSLEVRAKNRRLEGYCATFGTEARIGDFIESILPGAFAASLSGDIVALLDHDAGRLLARTRSKTLRLAEDSKGLAFDLDIPNTSAGNDALVLAERNDLAGCSFGFVVPRGGESWNGNKRTLTNVDLREISIISGGWPAYEGTEVIARNRNESILPLRLILARKYLETVR